MWIILIKTICISLAIIGSAIIWSAISNWIEGEGVMITSYKIKVFLICALSWFLGTFVIMPALDVGSVIASIFGIVCLVATYISRDDILLLLARILYYTKSKFK